MNIFNDTYQVVVQEENNVVRIQDTPPASVRVVDHGVPIIRYGESALFIDRTQYYSTGEKIAVGGFGEYYNSTFKPIFIFEDDSQGFQLEGYAIITKTGTNDPFIIQNTASEALFKINSEEIPVFKMHSEEKTPIIGGLLFKDGEIFIGC